MRECIMRRGERLCDLSARFGVPVCMLIMANNGRCLPGRRLRIPDGDMCRRAGRAHTVCEGDTVYSLAARHGVTMELLMHENGLGRPDELSPGMSITIPPLPPGSAVYTVRMGEDRAALMARTGASAAQIDRASGGRLYPGMQLVLPARG